MSVNDEADYPWLVDEKALVADAIVNGRAVLGVCLGAQVIASALGYGVFKNRESEIGWFPIQPTVEGEAIGLNGSGRVFHWHGETFDSAGRRHAAGVERGLREPGVRARSACPRTPVSSRGDARRRSGA